jgi:hypothetical protein
MLKRFWKKIIKFFSKKNNELEKLKKQYEFIYIAYIDMDKRTTASKELKCKLENIMIEIVELEKEIYG